MVLLFSFALSSCKIQKNVQGETEIVTEESILEHISEPVIPAYSINVKYFGAVGDSVKNDKPAFDKAIQAWMVLSGVASKNEGAVALRYSGIFN